MFEYVEYNLKRIFNLIGLKEEEFSIKGNSNEVDITLHLKRFSKKFDDVALFEDIRVIVGSFMEHDGGYKLAYDSMNYKECVDTLKFRNIEG